MLSIPTARPTSICPTLIWLAIVVTAIKPLEQNLHITLVTHFNKYNGAAYLLITCTGVLIGIPAAKAAARASYPAPFVKTVPTQMSPMRAGSMPDLAMVAYQIRSVYELSRFVGKTKKKSYLVH